MPFSPAVVIATLCALSYLPLTARPESLLRSVVKTASVALLAIAALGTAPPLLAVALALCALGDWLLSRPGEQAFMGGIAAFAAGHLAYVALFLSHPASVPVRLAQGLPLLLALALIALGVIMARRLAPRAGVLKGPVLAYIPIILGMGIAALTLTPAGALMLILPAALMFIASDLILAAETFVLQDTHPARKWTPYAVWPLYWGAQITFLAGFTLS